MEILKKYEKLFKHLDKIVPLDKDEQLEIALICEGKETPDENSNCIKHAVNQQRELLLAFCDHLNTYAGMEEIRFDFMMQDFIDKSQ